MRGRDIVDDNTLGHGCTTSREEVSSSPHHHQCALIQRLILLPHDGDGARVWPRRDGGSEDVNEHVALLRVEDPEALRHADWLRLPRRIGRDGVLERGAHTEVGGVGLAQVEGSRAVHGVEDGVVDGRVVDLVVDVEGEGLRALGWLPSSRHGGGAQRSGKQQHISEDGECTGKAAI